MRIAKKKKKKKKKKKGTLSNSFNFLTSPFWAAKCMGGGSYEKTTEKRKKNVMNEMRKYL